MKNHFFIALALIVLCSSAFAADDFAPGEILVKFKPGVLSVGQSSGEVSVAQVEISQDSIKALNMKHKLLSANHLGPQMPKYKILKSGKTINLPDTSNLYLLKFNSSDTGSILNDYKNDPNVEIASLNYIRKAFTIPNDPAYSPDQWALPKIHLTPIGAGTSGWDKTTGESTVKVAIIDTGVDYTHEDLIGRIDSVEGNGYINDGQHVGPMDDHGHGTHCAGILGAASNNGIGIAGVDWSCTIIPIKVLDSSGFGYDSDIISGINWAISKNVDVISMSLGGSGDDANLQNAVNNAVAADIVVVCAAGNDNSSAQFYPAAYPGMLAVAATDKNDLKASYSTYGTWVGISAPGGDTWEVTDFIYSTYPFDSLGHFSNNSYAWDAGTSMATPHVAGLASLIRAKYPSMSGTDVVSLIKRTADNIDAENPGYSGKLGSGRINAFNALNNFYSLIRSPSKNSTVNGVINIIGDATGEGFAFYNLSYATGESPALWTNIASSDVPVVNSIMATIDTTGVNSLVSLKLVVYGVTSVEYDTSFQALDPVGATGNLSYGPNPFNPNTTKIMFKYTLNSSSDIYIYIFDITGTLISRKSYSAGSEGGLRGDNRVFWDGKNDYGGTVANGVYLFHVMNGTSVVGKGKIAVIKR